MWRPFFMVLLAGFALMGCDAYSTESPPFMVSLAASTLTATPHDTITFTVNAQGANLLGVDLAYGDGSADQYATGGARTARVMFKHAFDATGTYTVRAAVTDAIGGQKDASVEVRIN